MLNSYSKAAAPRNTTATKLVAEKWRSDAAALKVGEADATTPDSEAVPVLIAEVPVAGLEAVPVATEAPVLVAETEETAVTKPVAVEPPAVPVAVEISEVPVVVETSATKEKIISNRFSDIVQHALGCVDPYQLCGRAGRSC